MPDIIPPQVSVNQSKKPTPPAPPPATPPKISVPSSNEPVKKSALPTFLLILVPVLLVSGIFYFLKQSSDQLLQNEIQNLKNQKEELSKLNQMISTDRDKLKEENEYLQKQVATTTGDLEGSSLLATTTPLADNATGTETMLPDNAVTASSSIEQPNPNDPYCLKEPTANPDGSLEYPLNLEKYGNIGILGQLFSAYDCGPERLAKTRGVKGEYYTLWPDIGLKSAPSPLLLSTLKNAGFKPGKNCTGTSEANCAHWTIDKTILINELMKIKPYVSEIMTSGCTNNCK